MNDKRAERCANRIWGVEMMPTIVALDTGRMGSALARAASSGMSHERLGQDLQKRQEAIQPSVVVS